MAPWEWSAPNIWWPLVALFSFALLHHQTSAAPPAFATTPFVATLYEDAGQTTTLMPLPCTDPDGDTVAVSLPSGGVSPSSPCGNCFTVLPCTAPQTGYCLVYYPGTLSQVITPQYVITVRCTDGTNTVSKTATVILIRNSPPTFNPNQLVGNVTVGNTKIRNAGYVIYDVNAVDVDSDSIIYSMTSSPASDNFEIGRGDGIIRAKNDLKSECNDAITFYVTITDGKNSPVGPLAVHATLSGSNQRPDITNLGNSLQVPEDTGKTVIHTLQVTDDEATSKLTYTVTATPPANKALYGLSGRDLRVQDVLDYEKVSARVTDLTIVASDGFCTSEPRNVRITVTDVNEKPDIQPEDAAYSVYEGPDFGPNLVIPWNIIDPDEKDSHTYEIIGGNNKKFFSMDPNTGQLTVNGDYDIDNNNNPTTQTLRVRVTDKGGLTDQTTVVLNFKDRNDKYPTIKEGNFGYSICQDRRIGATLGTLTCTDDDLTSPNNDVYITGGGGGITILPGGSIVLANPPALGQTIRTTAVCSDRGQYKGPLSSVTPVPITVTTVECPTVPPNTATQAPTQAPTTAAGTTTSATGGGTGNGTSWPEENLWWIILAALLLTALLGLLLYMLYVYCYRYCANCCKRQCCRRRRPPPKPRRQRYKPPRAVTPVETPREPLPPPAIIPDPFLYDFWKERYPDDDYDDQPNRKAKPRPITPENGVSPGGNGNNPEKSGGLSVPVKKKSRCTIL